MLLDTNVVSELRKPAERQDASVRKWAREVRSEGWYISAVTLMELERGVRLLEQRDPRQGARLRAWLESTLLMNFRRKIFPIDDKVARQAARLVAQRPRQTPDAMIAATALVHGLTVITRNVGDFEDTGVALLNPWEF